MAILTENITQTLPISQNLGVSLSHKFPNLVATNVPIFQTVTAVLIPAPNHNMVSQTIAVAPTIVISKIKSVQSAAIVAQAIVSNIDRVKSIIQNLPITQILTAYLDKGVSGNSGAVFVDPAIVAWQAGLTPPSLVTFSCNAPSALPNPINTSITLRKPDFGDTNTLEQFRVQRKTIGGSLDIFQDKMWPSTEKLDLSFSYLSDTDATALIVFLGATVGQLVTFNDQFGRNLTGYILTPFDQILQSKVNGWSAKFTFQIWEAPNSASP